MNTREDQVQMIDDCETRESLLNDTECGFIDSIKRQMAGGRPLTAKQDEWLDRIWERVSAGGHSV